MFTWPSRSVWLPSSELSLFLLILQAPSIPSPTLRDALCAAKFTQWGLPTFRWEEGKITGLLLHIYFLACRNNPAPVQERPLREKMCAAGSPAGPAGTQWRTINHQFLQNSLVLTHRNPCLTHLADKNEGTWNLTHFCSVGKTTAPVSLTKTLSGGLAATTRGVWKQIPALNWAHPLQYWFQQAPCPAIQPMVGKGLAQTQISHVDGTPEGLCPHSAPKPERFTDYHWKSIMLPTVPIRAKYYVIHFTSL